jgi:hypothetical protein
VWMPKLVENENENENVVQENGFVPFLLKPY